MGRGACEGRGVVDADDIARMSAVAVGSLSGIDPGAVTSAADRAFEQPLSAVFKWVLVFDELDSIKVYSPDDGRRKNAELKIAVLAQEVGDGKTRVTIGLLPPVRSLAASPFWTIVRKELGNLELTFQRLDSNFAFQFVA